MRKQNIALLNRIWKERACQVSNSISDDDNEPVSVEGSSNSVDLVRHLKSQRNIWNKMLRYEASMLDTTDPILRFLTISSYIANSVSTWRITMVVTTLLVIKYEEN